MRDALKRVIDLVVSVVGLVVLAPVQAVVALLVLVRLGRPVFFRQLRPGRHGVLFELVKFRTMSAPDPRRGLVSDADRLTAVGRALRAASLDELPTLLNVLRGDMSLVGPRPLLPQYLALYSDEQARRHEVRPGLTGLAQVRGRNGLSWPARLALDVEYIDTRSTAADLRILAATVRTVLRREGITAPDAATMPPFTGAAPTAVHDTLSDAGRPTGSRPASVRAEAAPDAVVGGQERL